MINRLLSIIVSIVIGSVALYAQSIDEIRKSAEAGDAAAQTAYAYALYLGKNIPQNTTEAVKWWNKAAAQGHTTTMNKIGMCYEFGWGVTKSIPTAMYWYKKAGDKGYQKAVDNYKQLYNQGYRAKTP